MKTLHLVRHARAVREAPTLADRDRPLDQRGARDAAAMGRRLAGRGVEPGAWCTSPALRALETARHFAAELGRPRAVIVVDDRLYASSADMLLAVVQGLGDRAGSAMLLGHNPKFSELVGRLSGRFVDLRPGAVAQLRFAARRWAEIGAAAAEACTIETPPG